MRGSVAKTKVEPVSKTKAQRNLNTNSLNAEDSKRGRFLSKSSKQSKTAKPFPLCTGESALGCKKDGYYVCLFDQVQQGYQTFCTADTEVKDHTTNANDYCGICSLENEFIHKSIVNSFDDITGTDTVLSTSGESFQVEYDVTFNQFNFVSMAASQDLILKIECLNVNDLKATIKITFKAQINPESALKMFPPSSFLVVDGSLFGSCNLIGSDDEPDPLNGFLFINQVSLSGEHVTVFGGIASINHFFDTLSIKYSIAKRRKLLPLGATTNAEVSWEIPDDDAPIKLKSKIGFDAKSFIEFAQFDWSLWHRTYNFQIDFGWLLKLSLSTSLMIEAKNKIGLLDKTYNKKWRLRLYGLPLAKPLQKFLKFFLPAAEEGDIALGLYLGAPVNFKLDLEQKLEITLADASIELSTGEKHARFSAASGVKPSIHFIKNENASAEAKLSLASDPLNALKITPMKIKGFGGILPQLIFLGMGLGKGKLGLNTGIYFETGMNGTSHFNPVPGAPGLPYEINCDSCHNLEATFSAGISDPFLNYTVLTLIEPREEKKIPIPSFELKTPLIQMCLDSITCPATSSPLLSIQVTDPDLIGTGGVINKQYSFKVMANNIPGNIDKVLLEWTTGYGAGGSANINTVSKSNPEIIFVSCT